MNLCWTRDDDNLSCLMKHKKIVEVREEHFPDPVRFLETLREEWPTDLPAYLQQVVIDAMPLKGEPYLCQMCGMRLPRERVEQVGYSNGSCFRVAVSLTCGIFADSNRMCTACSSQVFTRFLDVQEILYKTQMEDYDRLQREEEEETEGLQEYELGEPSDPDYITYMYASEVVVIDDSEREVIVID